MIVSVDHTDFFELKNHGHVVTERSLRDSLTILKRSEDFKILSELREMEK